MSQNLFNFGSDLLKIVRIAKAKPLDNPLRIIQNIVYVAFIEMVGNEQRNK